MRTLFFFLFLLAPLASLPCHGEESLAEQKEAIGSDEATIEKPGWYLGRRIAPTMSFFHARWLIRDTRDREEEPRKLIDAMELKHGQQVCDFGCGNGFYAIRIAPLLGKTGKVYGVDIQPEMLELLEERCEARGITNVESVLATEEESGLPVGKLDWLLLVDVYHELSEPAKVLGEIYKSLSPRGRIALVEFREEDPEVPIRPLHKMSQAQAMKELTANRFKLVGQFDELPWQHVLFFARDDSPLPSVQLKLWKSEESSPEASEESLDEAEIEK